MPKRAKPKPLVPHKPAATTKPSIGKPAATTKLAIAKPAAPKPTAAVRVPDDFETAERRVWDPAASSAAPRELLSGTLRRESLSAEIARGSGLRKLRLAFGERCRAAGVAPLVGAFERWHFGWLLAAADSSESLDPLLPQCAAPAADAELEAELRAAGVEAAAAAALVASLRADADAAAAAQRGKASSSATGERDGDNGVEVRHGGTGLLHVVHASIGAPLKLSAEHHGKLTAMHAHCGDGAFFNADLLRLLLRYKHLGGSGFQASLGGGAHAALRAAFGVTAPELFASPLNARSVPFCSAFPDVDAPFGSIGSFLSFRPRRGSYEANPPFAPLLITAMAAHLDALLTRADAAGEPLLFVVVVGAGSAARKSEAWAALQRLASGRFGRATYDVPLHQHGYTEGHAHIAAAAPARMSSCASAIFVVATEAAAEAHPCTPATEASIRAAFRLAVPRKAKRATKAMKAKHEERKQRRRAHQKRGR